MFSETIILVVGADLGDRERILSTLGDQSHVVAAQTMDAAMAHVGDSVNLVITEIRSGAVDGVELMRRWKHQRSGTPFLMLAEDHDVAAIVEAMKLGAADCILKPVNAHELRTAALQLLRTNGSASHSDDRSNGQRRGPSIDIPPDTSLEDLERAAVEQALVQHHGNRTHAARTLGISVRTLQRKLKAWGMPIVPFSGSSAGHNYAMAHTGASHAYGAHAL